jgi:hypothetical protein
MSPRGIALIVAAVRGIVRVVLLAHPRAFRRRFGAAILDEVAEDVRAAAAQGWRAAVRASLAAIVDAVAGLRVARAATGDRVITSSTQVSRRERVVMRIWMRDIWQDVRHGARSLAREPLFSVAVIVTLARHRGQYRDVWRGGSAVAARARACA